MCLPPRLDGHEGRHSCGPSWVRDMACLVRQPFRVTGPSMASLKAGLKDSVEILLPSVQNQRNGKGSRILQVVSLTAQVLPPGTLSILTAVIK